VFVSEDGKGTGAAPRVEDAAGGISLVRGDAAFRLMRRIGLIPAVGLGVARRAAALALVTWLPIAIWALIQRRAISGALDEQLLQHYGVSVSCLVAIPLLVLAEALVHARLGQLLPHFLDSGLVVESDRPRFLAIVRGIARLRDSTLPWIAILGLAVAWSLAGTAGAAAHQLKWAVGEGEVPALGFGGAWFVYVARPIYLVLALAWLWRLALLFLLLRRIAGLELSLVPTHPDLPGILRSPAPLQAPRAARVRGARRRPRPAGARALGARGARRRRGDPVGAGARPRR
jgi:hypothetical protein